MIYKQRPRWNTRVPVVRNTPGVPEGPEALMLCRLRAETLAIDSSDAGLPPASELLTVDDRKDGRSDGLGTTRRQEVLLPLGAHERTGAEGLLRQRAARPEGSARRPNTGRGRPQATASCGTTARPASGDRDGRSGWIGGLPETSVPLSRCSRLPLSPRDMEEATCKTDT